jgi:heme-degrading monooxygenase HmoA
MSQIVEVIRLQVPADRADLLVSRRPAVDAEVGKLAGFEGSELIHIADDQWMLLVYWATRADVVAAQRVTEKLQIITDWIAIAEKVLAFNTAEIRHSSR